MTLTAVLDRLRERAESDPSLLETLEHLAHADPVGDPFSRLPMTSPSSPARSTGSDRRTGSQSYGDGA